MEQKCLGSALPKEHGDCLYSGDFESVSAQLLHQDEPDQHPNLR